METNKRGFLDPPMPLNYCHHGLTGHDYILTHPASEYSPSGCSNASALGPFDNL